MDIKSLKTDTNFWIIIGTIVSLAIGYIFYLNYYIAGKEDRITSTCFRVLDQIGDNIEAKQSGYIENSDEIELKISRRLKDTTQLNLEEIIRQIRNEDINDDLKIVTVSTSIANKEIEESSKLNYIITFEFDSSYHKKDIESFTVLVRAPYGTLMNGLLRNDVFDDLILIRDSQVVYNTLGQDMILTYPDVLTAALNDSSSLISENAFKEGLIFSGMAFDIDISNKLFKAFLKPVRVNGETWYVLGLMERSGFNETSRSIAPMVIISLSLLLIFIILSLPLIKLKVISKAESLETGTIVYLALSVLLGGSLLILFAFFLAQNVSHNRDVDRHLEDLSTDIYDTLTEEISDGLSQLEAYDSFYSDTHVLDFNNPENPYGTKVRRNILDECKGSELYPENYEFGDYYFWLDRNGTQSAYLTPFDEFGTMSNLKSRAYFQKKDEWFFTRDDTIKFRMESIVSVSSGKVKVAMSMSSRNPREPVVALSSRFYSIIDPIIPKDYKFCIIDASGQVWFHSDIKRNLKENFISECNENKHLSAAIYRNIPRAISVDYYNNPYRIHISPIDQLPLYLITFYNQKAERSFQAQVISLTLLQLCVLFFMLFLQTVALLLINRRFQGAHDKKTILNLTRPMGHLNACYRYLIKVNVACSILFLFFMAFLRDFNAVLAVFLFAVYMFTYSHWRLNISDAQKKVRIWFTVFNLFILAILNMLGFLVLGDGFGNVLLFQGSIIVVFTILHLFIKIDHSAGNRNFSKNYIRSLLWLLILFGILPSLKFYEIANNNEVEIQARHSQINLMTQRELRNDAIARYYKRVVSDKVLEIQEKRKTMGVYTDFLGHTSFEPSVERIDLDSGLKYEESNGWDSLLSYIRPFYDEYNVESKYLILNSDITSGMEWKRTNKNTLLFQYVSLTDDPQNRKLLINTIKSHIPQLLFLKPYSPLHPEAKVHWGIIMFNSLFWLLVVGILYLFYLLIQFGTQNIFSLHIIEHYSNQPFIKRIHLHILAGSKLLITRLSPIDETDDFLREFIDTYQSFTLDWSDLSVVKDSPKRIMEKLEKFKRNQAPVAIINHFDWGYRNPEVFSQKLRSIDKIIRIKGLKLVILSQSDEHIISDYYQSLLDEKEGAEEKELACKFCEAFNAILNEVEVVRQAVSHRRSSLEENVYSETSPEYIENGEFVVKELFATDYLKRFLPAMKDYIQSNGNKINSQFSYHDVIKRIYMLAEKYYSDLLNSCNYEERNVLYDFADDLIVNPRNKDSIIGLLEKGILIKDYDRLNFFNVSFRRFLLNRMNRTPASQAEMKMKKETGTWKGYRLMIFIIIVALFVFIAMAKQDFFDNLNKLFILIAGGITAITGILGLLSRQNKTKDE